MNDLTRAGLLAVVLAVPASVAAGTIIDYDTTLDGTYGGEVEIREGVSPPTTVQIVDPAWFSDPVEVYDGSIVNVFGGYFSEELRGFDSSILSISGGNLSGEGVELHSLSSLSISGGDFARVKALDSSEVSVSGGNIMGGLYAHGSSTIEVRGGSIDMLHAGSPLGDHSAVIRIYGTGFNYPYGRIPDPFGILEGTLAGGQGIAAPFDIQSDASIVLLVPEPSSLWLLGMAIVAIQRPRRHSAPQRAGDRRGR